MKMPFPGMDPYLEHPALGPSVNQVRSYASTPMTSGQGQEPFCQGGGRKDSAVVAANGLEDAASGRNLPQLLIDGGLESLQTHGERAQAGPWDRAASERMLRRWLPSRVGWA